MKLVHDLSARISRWLAWLAGALILFGCAVPVAIDVAARAIIGRTVVQSFEISGYAFALCIGLGMGYTVTSKANIRVDILTAKLPRALRLPFDLAASIALAVTALAFAWYTFDVLKVSWRLDARSISTLQVPLILPQTIWWVGLAWFATVAVLTPIYAIARLLSGDPNTAETLISAPDLLEEMQESGITSVKERP